MTVKFLSLASGSSGNCYYLGTPDYGILLDAGIPGRVIRRILRIHGIEMEQILALFITHDHIDHIRSAGVLGKYGIPVYATQAVHDGLARSRFIDQMPTTSRRVIQKGEPIVLQDISVTAFAVPHDATDCVGYRLQCAGETVVLATDVGHIDDVLRQQVSAANHLILEANYDYNMLVNGRYPEFLKARIMDGSGHLSNREAAELIAHLFHPSLRNIWLCHLSKENNHPELALQTVTTALKRQGIRPEDQVRIAALQRTEPSDMYILNQ
jgi:phosphoribosyl 1,2-cyclic phosphodiesterase